jgi:hypothetical protein
MEISSVSQQRERLGKGTKNSLGEQVEDKRNQVTP